MILNIYKPVGPTSHDIVNRVRKILSIRKVGHAGTLDPFAEGALIILTEKDTKKSDEIMHQEKEYVAKIKLGAVTDTYDKTGVIKVTENAIIPTRAEVEDVIKKFIGTIQQIPPMFSAIKIRGKKLYELARKGIEINRGSRTIEIRLIEIISYNYPILDIRIICSSGTYIRSLAHDIGQELKCGGYVEELIRTRVGKFNITDSLDLENLRVKKL